MELQLAIQVIVEQQRLGFVALSIGSVRSPLPVRARPALRIVEGAKLPPIT